MLQLELSGGEWFDESKSEFVYSNPVTVRLEHSLLAISRWESKWKKPFLYIMETRSISMHELQSYFLCMEIDPSGEPLWPLTLSNEQAKRIIAYIGEEQTATTFHSYRQQRKFSREIITSEIVYYWMASLNIPFECETWNLSRLLTLVRIASIKGHAGEKMGVNDRRMMYHELNEKRKKQYHTRG